jgi:3,4-dihydroxy 2-butanone 4-phosphate synthase/GTP cyclohydrolase II
MFNTIEEAIIDLRQGKLIVVIDDEDRENEGDLVGIAEKVSPEMINFMAKEGRGLICVPVSESIARKLGFELAKKENVNENDTNFTDSVDYIGSTTGISAFERADTIKKMIDPNSSASDFRKPGHIFPLISKNGGVLVRNGHTEASTDLAKIAGFAEGGIICEIMDDDGTMMRLPNLLKFKDKFGLKIITIKDLVEYRYKTDVLIARESEARMPTEFGEFNLIAYSSKIDSFNHLALVKGNLKETKGLTPLVRVHSECITGDVFHSLRCDCGKQLEASMKLIEANGLGVIVYMRQEGRGIGLVNKLKAYQLQDKGYDTVEANLQLGLPADARDYGLAAQILNDLGLSKISLLTNNPTKLSNLEEYGIKVISRVPLQVDYNSESLKYIKTKIEKMGHIINP